MFRCEPLAAAMPDDATRKGLGKVCFVCLQCCEYIYIFNVLTFMSLTDDEFKKSDANSFKYF